MIAWCPGLVPAGAVSGHVGYFGDWFATAAELARAPPGGAGLDQFAPTLLGRLAGQKAHEFLYYEFHEGGFQQAALYRGGGKGCGAAARTRPSACMICSTTRPRGTWRQPARKCNGLDAFLKTALIGFP